MFTVIAILLIAAIGWWAARQNVKDRENVAILNDDEVRTAVLQARQDIKLIALLLAAVVVMLGVVADRLQ